MPSEKRTRVEIFLPLGSNPVFNEPVTEWLAEELAFTRGGSTITTPFTGLYVSATERDFVRDSVRILFCDFDLDPSDENSVCEIGGISRRRSLNALASFQTRGNLDNLSSDNQNLVNTDRG